MNLEDISPTRIADLKTFETVLNEIHGLFRGVVPYWRGHADWNGPFGLRCFVTLPIKRPRSSAILWLTANREFSALRRRQITSDG